jgi:hypothetical protein
MMFEQEDLQDLKSLVQMVKLESHSSLVVAEPLVLLEVMDNLLPFWDYIF